MIVSVLLSTYNGINFIRQQLDSIIQQTYKNIVVFIRDDGSTDDTVEVIKEFTLIYPGTIKFINDGYTHLGPAKSFMMLLSEVKSDYYFFCDQDDIWNNDKIEKTLAFLQYNEQKHPNRPILVHTDAVIADCELKPMFQSLWKHSRIHPSRLDNKFMLPVCCTVTGCTMAINDLAKQVSINMPEDALMHDSWIAFKVSQAGYVIPLYYQSMLYRQHPKNVIGIIGTGKWLNLKKIRSIKSTIKEYKELADFYKRNGYGSTYKWWLFKLLFFVIR